MELIKGDEYLTSDGFKVTFIRPIEEDGQYNVFRHQKKNDYRPYFTNSNLETAYGEKIIKHINKDKPWTKEDERKWANEEQSILAEQERHNFGNS